VIDPFGMQVSAKTLKLRRQQHRICMIDLLGCVTTTPSAATNLTMCVCNFVEFGNSRGVPVPQRVGRHEVRVNLYSKRIANSDLS
jgi:hypothetical protein